MFKRFFVPPKSSSYFLFGPRGTGKTTWLKQFYPKALWIDLLDSKVEREFAMRPETLIDRVEGDPSIEHVVIDEVQKVPKVLDSVHLLIEKKRGIQFVLAGSSARKLRRGGVNLLAGRALLRHFHGFIGRELGSAFDLKRALTTGLIPLIWDFESPEEKLDSYVDLYLREEVKAEALVRDVGGFARFLEVMAYSHGSVLNLSNISRECEVSRKTVESHLQILKDLLLGYTLDVFHKRSTRLLAKHPKFYFFDPGVFRALRKQGLLDTKSEVEGVALEGLVAEHLRCWIDHQTKKYELSFWRTRAGLEVDFILFGESEFLAIEIKNGTKVHPQDLRGLQAFTQDYPEATPLLIYRGTERLKREDVFCLPAEEFFLHLDPREKSILEGVVKSFL